MKYFVEDKQEVYVRITRNKSVTFAPHIHEHIEIVYSISATIEAFSDGHSYLIQPGQFFLTFPNQVHSYQQQENAEAYLFLISRAALSDFAGVFASARPLENVGRGDDTVATLCELAFRETGVSGREILNHYVSLIFAKLLSRLTLVPRSSVQDDLLSHLFSYCETHYRDPLTLAGLADVLHVSRGYLSHVFGEKLHIGFCDYINSFRIQEAKRLLRGSTRTMTDIAETVGFSSIRTFNRVFHEHEGVSPRTYRTSALPKH